MDAHRLLVGLDAQQRRAVVDPGAPLCILAGAGSGKTRVLTRRIAHRSVEGRADPRHVLALTFTRKAAAEMGVRLAALGLRDRPTVGTFHAMAWAQLRTLWSDRGRTMPGLLDRKGRVLAALPGRGSLAPVALATEIEWARARRIAPDHYAAAAHQEDRRIGAPFDQVARLYAAYETEKRRRGVVDFDDILASCADALDHDHAFAAAQRWRFRHLFVDEFQDVNPLQHRLLMGWLGEGEDLCVVGDPNQAIYRWNGADATYLTRFAEHHPGAQVVALTGNYRSTPQILHLASTALGARARVRLVAHRPAGEVPSITAYASDVEEARGIAGGARLLHAPGTRWDRQAVLVRTNGQMPLIEEAFVHARIPFRLRGADPLLGRPMVRDALRVLTSDRGRHLRIALEDLEAMVDEATADPGGVERADALAAVLRLGRELSALEPTATAGDLRPWLATAVGADGPGRDGDAIDVVTFHAAKGLEWPVVHIAGLEDGFVPVSHARTPEAESEERRLLHVALTRAEDVVRLSWAEQRTLRDREVVRRPSPYLAALSDALGGLARAARPADPRPGLEAARRALAPAEGEDHPLALLRALQDWRAEAARQVGMPPAVVLSDRILADVARQEPTDGAGLATVLGVGPLTLDAHGDALLRIVRQHRDPATHASRP
ncbi:ATP-dependent DNA helicase UvrD2 [Iamia sp.]|uniref:ATP-dependent helicase n=1 Tax=Iamia sp. TaxID=2722710 RepID=UPI002B7CFFB5|nr:ATP-dependent DNA helicase UvrD2 [Iamia sp.]HXH56867.1 ATP-dependent DNA helicase UvrD2 [Iamia sp.]